MSPPTFESWFEDTFGSPLPVHTERSLLQSSGILHWSTHSTAELGPSAMMLPTFRDDLAPYVVAGAWGRGLTANAFYWIEHRCRHRAFFRLPWRNAYADPESEAQEIVSFLRGYATWRAEFEPRLAESLIVHSMGTSRLELRPASAGRTLDPTPEVPHLPDGRPLPAVQWWQWLCDRAIEAS